MSDMDRPVCYISGCTVPATRDIHFPSLDTWKPYCQDHTPLESQDEDRSIGTGMDRGGEP